MEMNKYDELIIAIINQAIKDWRASKEYLYILENDLFNKKPSEKYIKYRQARCTYLIFDTEKFFKSKWFSGMTTVDGQKLLDRLNKEFNENHQ